MDAREYVLAHHSKCLEKLGCCVKNVLSIIRRSIANGLGVQD